MENWLNEVELKGEIVTLLPMRAEHGALLAEAAADGHLWRLWFTSVPDASSVDTYIKDALIERQNGTALPFVVFHNRSQKIIGTTRFCSAEVNHKRLEIGYTWYGKSFQRTGLNRNCKQLLFQFAFEEWGLERVELRADANNQPSINAMIGLG